MHVVTISWCNQGHSPHESSLAEHSLCELPLGMHAPQNIMALW